jgi:DNA repair photolyase
MDNDDVKLVWFILHPAARVWSVNPYRKCAIRCGYCIASSQGDADPWFGADRVVAELQARLSAVPPETEIFIGALTDAYPPEEERLEITRAVLTELSRQRRPFCIATKSKLVQRDLDILLGHRGHCDVYISLCTLDQSVVAKLEPGAASVAERLQIVSALDRAGVVVAIDAAPWIPGVSDIAALLEVLPANVAVQVAPLDIRSLGAEAKLAGMSFTQEEINRSYLRQREAVGESRRVRWKEPV